LGLTNYVAKPAHSAEVSVTRTLHKTVSVNGLDIFYREAGDKDAPTLLLLHGFPTSSQMFRNLIPALADTWTTDQYYQGRPGNKAIQLQLFYDYGSNPALYPQWQACFRDHQPPTLVVRGGNDVIFPADGAYPYKWDMKNIDFHLLDTGHFALEEDGDKIARLIQKFMAANVS
jgi:pimeloyl-ACP methyl ester carboxylesterase